MILFPAIDIKKGRVVRLLQGKFDALTEYSGAPTMIAQKWQAQGAQWLHVVDLDGAQTGKPQNIDVILKIVRAVSIPIQVGGGLRRKKDIQELFNGGVARVILGTKVIEDRDFLAEAVKLWHPKIAVSLDCSKGFVAHRGWTAASTIKAADLAKELENYRLSCLIYTDIARDGMLGGPNFEGIQEMLQTTKIPLIASGGIARLEDIKKLSLLKAQGLMGAIIGKALYEGKIDLKKAITVASR